MDRKDHSNFKTSMTTLSGAFDKTLSAPILELYWRALEDFDWPAIAHALERGIRQWRFMPKPADIRELVEGSIEDRAIEAWSILDALSSRFGNYPSLFVQDPVFAESMIATFGGWATASAFLHECSFQMEASKRNDFVRHYRTAARKILHTDTRYLAGRDETESRNNLSLFASRWRDCGFEFFVNEVVIVKLDGTHERRNFPFSLESGHLQARVLDALCRGEIPDSVSIGALQAPIERLQLTSGEAKEMSPQEIGQGLVAFSRRGFSAIAPLDAGELVARRRLLQGQANHLIAREAGSTQEDAADLPFEAPTSTSDKQPRFELGEEL